MLFTKSGDVITIKYRGESIKFTGGLSCSRKKTMTVVVDGKTLSNDALVFPEINMILKTIPEDKLDKLWEIYQITSELVVEDVEVRHRNVADLINGVLNILPPTLYTDTFPRNSLWIPDNLAATVEGIEVNHFRDMTFIKSEYHDLVVFSLMLRPLIPMMMMMGVYNIGSSEAAGRRQAVDNRYRLMDVIENTRLMTSPVVDKLRAYIPEVVKFSLGKTEGRYNAPNLYLTASIAGHGSDALDTYFISFIMFNSLPYHAVGYEHQATSVGTSVVVRMFRDIETECEKNYTTRVSDLEVTEKLHAMKHTIGGDEAKLSVIDIIGARSKTPMEEWIIEEEHIKDYRHLIKNMPIELVPADVKLHIDNALNTNISHYDTMHVFLIALALQQPMGDVRNAHDLGSGYFEYALGIAQEYYRARGFRSLARLLSCSSLHDYKISDYPFNPIDNTLKERIARYYPQEYHTTKNQRTACPALLSVKTFLKQHLNQRRFTLKVTCPTVASRIGVCVGESSYIPTEETLCELAEALYLQAKSEWRYQDPEIEKYL